MLFPTYTYFCWYILESTQAYLLDVNILFPEGGLKRLMLLSYEPNPTTIVLASVATQCATTTIGTDGITWDVSPVTYIEIRLLSVHVSAETSLSAASTIFVCHHQRRRHRLPRVIKMRPKSIAAGRRTETDCNKACALHPQRPPPPPPMRFLPSHGYCPFSFDLPLHSVLFLAFTTRVNR